MEFFVTFLTAAIEEPEPWGTIIALLTGLVGLIGTGISTYFTIKAIIEKNKGKSLADIWELIMSIADEAMKAAEASGKKGEDKKKMVIDAVNAAALAAGIDVSPFTEQLSAYIDQTIAFVNDLNKKRIK